MLSSGLLLPHTHAVPDRHANVGYGHCCQVHHRRMADASAGDGSAELVALLLPSWRQDERTRDNIIHAMMSPMMQGKLYGVVFGVVFAYQTKVGHQFKGAVTKEGCAKYDTQFHSLSDALYLMRIAHARDKTLYDGVM